MISNHSLHYLILLYPKSIPGGLPLLFKGLQGIPDIKFTKHGSPVLKVRLLSTSFLSPKVRVWYYQSKVFRVPNVHLRSSFFNPEFYFGQSGIRLKVDSFSQRPIIIERKM